jgi:uncharacterized membrane protein
MPTSLQRIAVFIILLLCSIQAGFAARPVLHLLPKVRGGGLITPVAISDNGRVLIGNIGNHGNDEQAIHLIRSKPLMIIPMDIPTETTAVDFSADGSVVLGVTHNAANRDRAFLWSKKAGTVELAVHPDFSVIPAGISTDGLVAVGSYYTTPAYRLPFYWSVETGFQSLSISNYEQGTALAVSRDGTVVVGYVTRGVNDHACRWVYRGEPELLDPLAIQGRATHVTPDGSVIAAYGYDTNDVNRSFVWRGGFREFINPGEGHGTGMGVFTMSADGSRVIGIAWGSILVWTTDSDDPPIEINELYHAALPHGWSIVWVYATSGDGRWITGLVRTSRGELRSCVLDTRQPTQFR